MKVMIICPEHGIFRQKVNNHLGNRQGCPKCGGSFPLSTEDFIEKATNIHGDKWDYSKVVYVNSIEKVEIICSEHGSFFQKPFNHITNNQGCPKCKSSSGEELIRKILTELKVSFVEQERFGGKYPYDFWLPEYKLAIEYNGIQHYEVDGFMVRTDDELEKRKKVDKQKKMFILNRGNNFLEIPYWEKENSEFILKGLLFQKIKF